MNPIMLAAVLLISSLLVPVGTAQAASFDCKKAKSKLEKHICADPALGKADELLAKAYGEALKVFVIPGFIKDSQLAWLHSAPSCLTADSKENQYGQTCAALYAQRTEALHLYTAAKVYTNYAKKFSHDDVTLITYQKNNAMWLDWYGDWMPSAYKPKPFPEGYLAQETGKLIPNGNKYGLEERDDADITISDDKIHFGGEFGMSVSARQAPLFGDYARVK